MRAVAVRVTTLHVNGTVRPVDTVPERSLLSVLRDDLDLTGAKYGCGEAQCGACMVLIDGQPFPACITPVSATVGKRVLTVEGVAPDGQLHPVQQAFLDAGALQCGYCTPGMIISALGLLSRNPDPTDREIVQAMDRNICRCGTYSRSRSDEPST